MAERLRRSGVRCISPVVDVTNYVLLELGQPMHAFDRARLSGGVVVRMAREGEALALLDGQTVTLRPDTLVIADAEKPLAMAGIMGGQASAVGATTRDIFLESAFFAPLALAGRARSYGLHTDSSHRFERGVDPALQLAALERAVALGGADGPYVLQAALAACHARAQRAEDTDWRAIAALYDRLLTVTRSPIVAVGRAVAHGMAFGPEAGLALLDELAGAPALKSYAPFCAARADCLLRAGRAAEAAAAFEAAATMTKNEAERAFLMARAAGC